MKIRITRGTVADLLPREPGDILEVPDGDGQFLVDTGKAELFVEPEAAESPPVDPPPKIRTSKKMKKPKAGDDD